MDRNALLKLIYESGIIQKVTARIASANYAEDLTQEIILIIAKKNPDDMERIFKNNQMPFYVTRIAKNIYDSNNSFFVKLYRHNEIPEDLNLLSNLSEEDYDNGPDEIYNLVYRELDKWPTHNGFPYEKKMFLLFVEIKNKKEIERLTGIPYRTICAVISECQKKLKYAIKQFYQYGGSGY